MEFFDIAWPPIATILGAYILIDQAYTKIKARIHPATSIPAKVRKLDERYHDYLEEHQKVVDSLSECERINKLQCKAMLDIMRHIRDGNHVENMNRTIREIEDIIVDI